MTKNPLKLLKNYLGELMLVIGSGIFVYNVLDFAHKLPISGIQNAQRAYNERMGEMPPTIYYYFSHDTISWITFGAVLIVIGILVVRSKKNNP